MRRLNLGTARCLRSTSVFLGFVAAWSAACGADPKSVAPNAEPLPTAPAGQWAYVPMLESRCIDGAPTGIAVNYAPQPSGDWLIAFEGGGACFDGASCALFDQRAGDEPCFSEAKLEQQRNSELLNGSIFDRQNAENPFATMNFLFIPYDSGDVFLGAATFMDAERGLLTFQGKANAERALARVAATANAATRANPASATRTVMFGASAGGYGALYSAPTCDWFERSRCYVVDVSGLLLPNFPACRQQRWIDRWNLSAGLAELCPECVGETPDLSAIFSQVAKRYPDVRYGLVSSGQDVVASYFGFGEAPPSCELDDSSSLAEPLQALLEALIRGDDDPSVQQFRQGVCALQGELAMQSNVRTYVQNANSHIYYQAQVPELMQPLSDVEVNGLTLWKWLQLMLQDDPAWQSLLASGVCELS